MPDQSLETPDALPDFHAFARGRPVSRVFQAVSSSQAPAHERYSYWTGTQLRNVQADRPNLAQKHDFQAYVISLATCANEMHYSVSDALSGERSARAIRADQSDELSLIYVLEGQVAGRFDNEEVVAAAGDFYLYDSLLPQRIAISRHRLVQIDLPRALVATAFAGKTPSPGMLRKALAGSRLTPLLRSHLAQFPKVVADMSPVEQQSLLEASEAFTLSVLQGALGNQLAPRENCAKAVLLAAQRYIQRNIDKPGLDPLEISIATGCSRATLYRIFKRHNLTISGYIRELRLRQFLGLLQNASDDRSIAALAQCCGLYDAPNVNQMFRRRFGISPSDARARRTEHSRRFPPPPDAICKCDTIINS